MSEMYLIKASTGGYYPADTESRDKSDKLKIGETYKVKYSKPRNYAFHKKYFALLNLAFENQERYDCFEAFRDAVTMQAGHFDSHTSLAGTLVYKPKSISFSKMGCEIEFGKLYNRTINVILQYVMVGSTVEEIERVLQFG